MSRLIKIYISNLLFLVIANQSLLADWQCRSDSTLPVVTQSGNQWNVHLTSDQKNGAILVWQDRRDGINEKVFVQRVNSAGVTLWQTDGLRLAATDGNQYFPQIVSDGPGSAFVVWQDNRSGRDYDIYAQKIDANGNFKWTLNGLAVCTVTGHQYNPQIVSDGAGGIIVVWQDKRAGQYDIYAQRIDSVGNIKWMTNGQAVCTDTSDQVEPKLISDKKGGAIIAWADYRLGRGTTDIYCQRVLGTNGALAWTHDIPICTELNAQFNIQIVTDGTGGGIISWQDRRNGTYDNIYAQRIDEFGGVKWSQGGIPIAPVAGMQCYPIMVPDGPEGSIVVWQDNRKGSDYDIYAQKILPSGALAWSTTGKAVCTTTGHQYNPQVIFQKSSAVVVWQDKRSGNYDIYAQRLDNNGQSLWTADGVPVSISLFDQFMPQIASDSLQGAIMAWSDYHLNNGSTDIFAHRIGANGYLAGGCYRTFTQDSLALRPVRLKRLRNRLLPMPNGGNVRDSVFWRGVYPYGFPIGINRSDDPKNYGWIKYTQAYYLRRALPQWGTPRPFDYFGIRRFVGEKRNVGNSMYNNKLAGELLALKLNIAASDLGITQEGFGDIIFVDTSKQINILNNKKLRDVVVTVDSIMTMWSSFKNVNYIQLSLLLQKINYVFDGVVDTVSGIPLRIASSKALFSVPFLQPNSGPPTIIPSFNTQNIDEEVPDEYVLLQNYPNPFNPLTTIEFVLPEPSMVTLKVFNILGQVVNTLIDRSMIDDEHQVVDFDASNLSSGVYFYQLIAEPISGGHTINQVKKMIVLK